MKKVNYLLVLTLLLFTEVNAQPNFSWAKKVGGSGNDGAADNCVDSQDNFYSVGDFNGTVDFDPGAGVFNMTSTGLSGNFINKFDASGNFVWAKQLASLTSTGQTQIASIAYDINGNLLITGSFLGATDFDPGPGTNTMAPISLSVTGNGYDIFVLKLDVNGNFIWARQFGGVNNNVNISGVSIVTDPLGNVYSTGLLYAQPLDFDPGPGTFTLSSNGVGDVYISKLNASGNFIWAKSFGGSGTDQGRSIDLDASNNIYLGGLFSSTVDFDPGPGTFTLSASGSNYDAFLQKLDQNGNFLWVRGWGGINNDICSAIEFRNNVVIAGGYFRATVDFDPSAATFTMVSNGAADGFVSAFDQSGNFIWARQVGGTADDILRDLTSDNAGNVYAVGSFSGTADFDPGPGSYTLAANGIEDAFVFKLNQSGSFVMAGQFVGSGYERCESISLAATGHMYLVGAFNSSPTDFDPTPALFNLNTAGSTDAFFVKLASCFATPSNTNAILGSNSICSTSQTYSVPNISEAISYSWTLPGGWSGTSTTNIISGTPGGSGIMSVTAINACGSSSAQTLSVTVNPNPTISVNSGAICNGGSFTINPSGANTYTIQGGNAVVSPTSTTSYTVIGTSSAGCVSNTFATSNITVNPLPTVSANTSTNQLCVGSSATLTGSGASTYTWNPGGSGSNIVISPTVNTTYTVTGTDVNGCQNTSVITQSVINCSGGVGIVAVVNSINEVRIYPNPFNGKFYVANSSIIETPVFVHNALGKVIFEASLKDNLEIDLGTQANGVYFIRVGSNIKKIIKY